MAVVNQLSNTKWSESELQDRIDSFRYLRDSFMKDIISDHTQLSLLTLQIIHLQLYIETYNPVYKGYTIEYTEKQTQLEDKMIKKTYYEKSLHKAMENYKDCSKELDKLGYYGT